MMNIDADMKDTTRSKAIKAVSLDLSPPSVHNYGEASPRQVLLATGNTWT